MRTMNSVALVLAMSLVAAPALAVGGLNGSGSGATSGGVDNSSIDGAQNRGNTDPMMEEREDLDNRKPHADRGSINEADRAASERDRQASGDARFSADRDGASGSASADTEEAEE